MSIDIQGLTKGYPNGNVALKDVSLHIAPGIYGLLGPNGAGKTTLMRILATLLPKTEGRVSIFGYDLEKGRDSIRGLLGYLPQQFGAYPNLSAMEFLDYILLMGNMKHEKDRRSRIEEVLSKVNLFEHRFERLAGFSGGMIRRIGIAQALLSDPQFIIVDEPTAGLDPEERIAFRNMLDELFVENKNRVVILSTHIVQDISHICEQVGVLKEGELIFSGTPEKLAALGKGHVYHVEADQERASLLTQKHRVISRAPGSHEGTRCLRIFSNEPVPDGVLSAPTIEEGYLALVGGGADAV